MKGGTVILFLVTLVLIVEQTYGSIDPKLVIEINSGKTRPFVVSGSGEKQWRSKGIPLKKSAVGNVAFNPCFDDCIVDCLKTCIPLACPICPLTCAEHDTCKPKKISGKLEAAVVNQYCKVGCASLVCAPIANTRRLNSVADEQGSMEHCNNGCSRFCNKHFAVSP